MVDRRCEYVSTNLPRSACGSIVGLVRARGLRSGNGFGRRRGVVVTGLAVVVVLDEVNELIDSCVNWWEVGEGAEEGW